MNVKKVWLRHFSKRARAMEMMAKARTKAEAKSQLKMLARHSAFFGRLKL